MGVFKIKKIILIVTLCLLCGCTATYEIEVKDGKIYERGSAVKLKSELDNSVLNNGMTLEQEIDLTLSTMHDIENGQEEEKSRSFLLEKINNSNEIGLRYEHNFEDNKYLKSPILKQCYDDIVVKNTNTNISMNTISKFNCFDYYKQLDKVTFILTTDYKVYNSNYDEKKDNKYYWYINKENINKGIYVNIEKTKKTFIDDLKEENKNNSSFFKYVFSLLGVFLLLSVFIIFIKIKKSNK